MNVAGSWWRFVIWAAPALIAVVCGCSQFIDPNVPEPIRPFVEPQNGREYLLYRPSHYDREYAWPLIVVCHSSFPDSPGREIRGWTERAESRGFIVAVPSLLASKKPLRDNADRQIPLQRKDEAHILSMIQHIRAGHSISEDRIFVHGWSRGAFTALHAGLRHPELFRAVSVMQPVFSSDYLADVGQSVDNYQPVRVNYSAKDAITGKDAHRCVEWLRDQGANLWDDSVGRADRKDPSGVVDFFDDVIRRHPRVRIASFPADGDNPLRIQFKVRCSYTPTRYKWEFGDGDKSYVADPIHQYPRAGRYRVTVTVFGPKDREDQRVLTLLVP
jgi:dienelactone hydrolase